MLAKINEICFHFLSLGFLAFGGPLAHISLMQKKFVEEKKWLSLEEFLELVAYCNLVPGPNSTELAMHIGYKRAGWLGFWLAGLCFIVPALLLVWLLAYIYVQYGQLPELGHYFSYIYACLLALIAHTLYKIGQQQSWEGKKIALVCFALLGMYLGLSEISCLGFGAALYLLFYRYFKAAFLALLFALLPWGMPLLLSHEGSGEKSLSHIFLLFAKIGSTLFGSGYVLLSYIRTEFVTERSWLTEQQLLDTITAGQITPGPLFTSASFAGYLLRGNAGVIAASLGIFLPAFLFAALSIYARKYLQSPSWKRALDAFVLLSIGLLLFNFLSLIPLFLSQLLLALLSLAAFIALWRKVNFLWLLAASIGLAYLIPR